MLIAVKQPQILQVKL